MKKARSGNKLLLTKRQAKRVILILLAMLAIVFPAFIYTVHLEPVEGLRVQGSQSGTVEIEWDHEGPRSYYLISVLCDGEKYGEKYYKTKDTSYRFKELPGGHKYSFYVWTVRNGRKSEYRLADADVAKYIYAPEMEGKSDGYRRIDLSWEKVDEADGYTISETVVATGETTKQNVKADVTSLSFYDKAAGGTYEYKIRSYAGKKGNRKTTEWSDPVQVTAKTTTIGQASSDNDGKAGDGGGREVATARWDYSSSGSSFKNWTYVFRFKDKDKALAAADMMEKAIANDNIGYCSNGTKKYGNHACQKLAAQVDYDLSKISVKTGCSCGDIVTLCIKSTGTECPYEGSGPAVARILKERSDDFECYSEQKYVASEAYLERGDILVSAHSNGKNNHVCMVL